MPWEGFQLTIRDDASISVGLFEPRHARRTEQGPVSLARDSATGSIAVCHGRLFYLNDFLDYQGYKEGLEALTGEPNPTTAQTVVAIVREFGASALRRLEGDYSIALWDARTRRLLGLRDPLGGGPLYWWRNGRVFGMTSQLSSMESKAVGAANPEYLAECLTRSFGAGEVFSELTPISNVFRVLPGTLVELPLEGDIVRNQPENWLSEIPQQNVASVEEAGEILRGLLDRAVQERIRGRKAAVHFSGGLDSTSIAALMRDVESQMDAGWELRTLSLVYHRGELAAERPFIDGAIQHLGVRHPLLLPADNVLDFDLSPDQIPEHDEPRSGLRGLATQRLMVDAADQEGADVILTGVGSDEILVSTPDPLFQSVRRFQWFKALREARRLARIRNEGIWSVLVDDALSRMYPILCREGIHPYFRNGRSKWPALGLFTVPPWVRKTFARRFSLFELGRARARQIYVTSKEAEYQRTLLTAAGDWNRQYLAAPRGITISHPFRDIRVIRFVSGLPEDIRAGTEEETKPVLRAAVRRLVPESIRVRSRKQGFDDVNGRALNHHQSRIEKHVRASAFNELEVIDVEALCAALQQAAVGVGDIVACDRLGQTLALVGWYERWSRVSPRCPDKVFQWSVKPGPSSTDT